MPMYEYLDNKHTLLFKQCRFTDALGEDYYLDAIFEEVVFRAIDDSNLSHWFFDTTFERLFNRWLEEIRFQIEQIDPDGIIMWYYDEVDKTIFFRNSATRSRAMILW